MGAQASDGLHAGGVQHQHLLVVHDGRLGVVQHVVDARQAQQQPRLARELLTVIGTQYTQFIQTIEKQTHVMYGKSEK